MHVYSEADALVPVAAFHVFEDVCCSVHLEAALAVVVAAAVVVSAVVSAVVAAVVAAVAVVIPAVSVSVSDSVADLDFFVLFPDCIDFDFVVLHIILHLPRPCFLVQFAVFAVAPSPNRVAAVALDLTVLLPVLSGLVVFVGVFLSCLSGDERRPTSFPPVLFLLPAACAVFPGPTATPWASRSPPPPLDYGQVLCLRVSLARQHPSSSAPPAVPASPRWNRTTPP